MGRSNFPALVWRQRHRDGEPPVELLEPFGGTNVERDDAPTWVFERGLDYYVGHAPGRDVLHLDLERDPWASRHARWLEERDPALLVREPCLTSADARTELWRQLDATLCSHKAIKESNYDP